MIFIISIIFLFLCLIKSVVRHNAEDFSKLAFGAGKYRDFDMGALDVTNIRDFATFMALTSNNQGKNGHLPLENWNKKIGNSSWSEFCHTYEEANKGS